MIKLSKKTGIISVTLVVLAPLMAFAHEAYVVPKDYFWQRIARPINWEAFDALKNPHNLEITLRVIAWVLFLMFANFLFLKSKVGFSFHKFLERFAFLGPIAIRVTIALSFFWGILTLNFLGPELSIQQILFPVLIH